MQHDEIKGFTDQNARNKALVNENKVLEEQIMRQLDKLKNTEGLDQRAIAVGVTNIQQAFMWINRGVFQPQRIELPEGMKLTPDEIDTVLALRNGTSIVRDAR